MRYLKAFSATLMLVGSAFPGVSYAQPAPAPVPAENPASAGGSGQPAPTQAEPAQSAPAQPAPATPARTPPDGPGTPVVAGELPGSIKIPGTETSLRIYGHVHVDATFDIEGRIQDYNDYDWASAVFAQPLDGNNELGSNKEGQFFLTARTSRFGFTTSTPTGIGPLVTKIEADFNGPNSYQSELATNSTLLRLRHGYGEVAGLLIGQTWTNFTDLGSFPDTVDFNPSGDTVLIRQAMIRYARPIGPTTLSVAVENSRSLTLNASSDEGDEKWYQVPDVTLNFTFPWSFGHVSARGVTLQYKIYDQANRRKENKQAWGAALSGSLKFIGDNLVWGAQGGDGIGRYTFNALLQGGYYTGEDIELWKSVGYHVGFTHNWLENLRSNVIWSQTFFESNDAILDPLNNPDGLGAYRAFNERIDQGFVNTFWGFMKNAEIGLEYAYGQRRTFDGETGTQHRINASFHYNLL